MEKSNGRQVLPVCMMLHEMISQLLVIIRHCDLATEEVPTDSACAKRFRIIGETARRVAQGMHEHQCELTDLLRTTRLDKLCGHLRAGPVGKVGQSGG